MNHTIKEHRLILGNKNNLSRPTLFLDRDGVIIKDKNYIQDPKLVELMPGAKDILSLFKRHSWKIVVITNQSGISRGYFGWNEYEAVTNRMLELLGQEAEPTAIYANGHGPEATITSWRKPSPQMILTSSNELSLALDQSILVGDRLSDLQSGASAGIKRLFHVKTGHGEEDRANVETWNTNNTEEKQQTTTDYHLTLLDSLKDLPTHHRLQAF